MTTAEAIQVGAFRRGKGHFGLLIKERRTHLLQPLVLHWRLTVGTADKRSLCSCDECVVGLNLCGTQSRLSVS